MKDILAPAQHTALQRIARRNTLLAFDYDGTLAPIVADPSAAYMRDETRERLLQLARICPVAVITGRSRQDVMRLLSGVPLIEIIGNHGFECDGARPEQYVRRVREWRERLQAELDALPGVHVEDKRYSLAVHFRASPEPAHARSRIDAAAALLEDARLVGGKSVLNIVPQEAPHKGSALLRLQARLNSPQVLYLGDDDTDEDVFQLEKSDALIGVRVGASPHSAADYYLDDQQEVDRFLEVLLREVHGEGH